MNNNNNNIDSKIMSFAEIANINYIDNMFLMAAASLNIDNIKECTISDYKTILQLTGSKLFPKKSNILKIEHNIFLNGFNKYSNNNMYDFYKLQTILDIYVFLSHKYNKLIHSIYYGYLLNISSSNIYTLLNTSINYNDELLHDDYIELYKSKKVNSIRLNIAKILLFERENNLTEKCYNSGGVALLAVCNHEYGWNNAGSQQIDNNNNLLSVNELPVLIDKKED